MKLHGMKHTSLETLHPLSWLWCVRLARRGYYMGSPYHNWLGQLGHSFRFQLSMVCESAEVSALQAGRIVEVLDS